MIQIQSTLTGWSEQRLRNLVDMCNKDLGLDDFQMGFKNSSKDYWGRCYPRGCMRHTQPYIVIRVGKNIYPMTMGYSGKGYIPHQVNSQEELIISLIAHEMRHIWQAKYPSLPRLGGGRGKFSEKDADTFAINILTRVKEITV